MASRKSVSAFFYFFDGQTLGPLNVGLAGPMRAGGKLVLEGRDVSPPLHTPCCEGVAHSGRAQAATLLPALEAASVDVCGHICG